MDKTSEIDTADPDSAPATVLWWGNSIRGALVRSIEILLVALQTALLIVLTMQIVWRYVLQHSLSWSEELARFLFVWVVALGASLAFKRGSHITIDLVVKMLPRLPRQAIRWVSCILNIGIWLLVAMTTLQLLPIVDIQQSPALGLPMGWPYASLLVGSLLTLIFLLLDAIEEVRGRKDLLIADDEGKEVI